MADTMIPPRQIKPPAFRSRKTRPRGFRKAGQGLIIVIVFSSLIIPSPINEIQPISAKNPASPNLLGDSYPVQYISAGSAHTCGIKPDNSIECWGDNDYGQLNVPDPNTDFVQVSAGANHACGRKSGGSLVCWGDDSSGQAAIPGPNTNFTQVSSGANHTCGLKSDGSLVCWGDNSQGQITIPVPNANWDQVSAGSDHNCGLKDDSSLVCWGSDAQGQSSVPGLNGGWSQVRAGSGYSCGLKNDGSLQCWGNNSDGQTSIPSPNSDYSLVSTGDFHTCGRKSDGTVVCWGRDDYGQATVPSPNSNFAQVSLGTNHSCGLKSDGSFICWGDDSSGQSDPNLFTQVSAGGAHTCALTKAGVAKCWGGYGGNINGEATVPLPNNGFSGISAGLGATCGMTDDSSLICWGGSVAPVPVPNSDWSDFDVGIFSACAARGPGNLLECWGDPFVPPEPIPGAVIEVSNGFFTICAIQPYVIFPGIPFEPIVCWSDDGLEPSTAYFSLSSYISVSAGDNQVCGIRDDNMLNCWGDNSSGESTVPDPNSNWKEVSVGIDHACGLKYNATGDIICWGDDSNSQSTVPAPNADFAQIDAGYFHTCGLKNDGALLCWGLNNSGQTDVPHLDTLKTPPGDLYPPTAEDDSYSTLEDTPLTVNAANGVLANDHDLDGDPLTAHKDSDPSLGSVTLAADGSFIYTPDSDLCGPDSFTYHAEANAQSSNTATVDLSLTCQNDPPTTTGLGTLSIAEDSAEYLLDLWPYFDDLEDSDLQLVFSVENHTNPGLFSLIDIDQDRYLQMAYTPDEFGTSTITVRATDTGALYAESDLELTVRPVNDAPSFTPGGDITVPMNSGPYSASWASSISPGPSNESSQSLAFSVSNNQNGLFTVQPALSAAGTLTFSPVPGTTGSAQVYATLGDDGGTTDGGVDASLTEVFSITVAPFPTVTNLRAETDLVTPGDTVFNRVNEMQIQFDQPMDNPPGDSQPDDLTNPENYLVVEAGVNGILETTSCLGGIAGDDREILISWVQFPYLVDWVRVYLNRGNPIPSGSYRFLACGSTSLTSNGIALAGDGINSGTDFSRDFRIIMPLNLPETGFSPGVVSFQSQPAPPSQDTGLELSIPRLGLSLPITGVPFQNEGWDVSWLSSQAGWLEGSAFPTWAGNSILTGHVVSASGLPGPFYRLGDLRYGDRIYIEGWGQSYIYEVRSVAVRPPDDLSQVLKHEVYPWLTLITCSDYSPWQESYRSRIVVRAVQIEVR